MLKQCDADLEDVDGFTDFARSIKGVEVSFMISEINQNKFRINFRSRGKYIINDIAQSFNGGGHKLAAGATALALPYAMSQLEKRWNPVKNKRKEYQNKKATEYEKKSGTTKEDGYFR